MSQFVFGTGNIAAAPVGGGAPAIFGTISGASVDISGDVKQLYGQNKFPDDVAVGKQKITGKITVGRIDLTLMSRLMFGGTVATGQLLEAVNEAGAIPASSPYTVTSANAATWDSDMGVYYAATGTPLVQVASGPAAGQYSVAAGVYTFAAADTGKGVLLTYAYGITSSGSNLEVDQTLMGTLQTFQLTLLNNYKGKTFGIRLYSCVADKLNFPFKQDDFLEQEFDFSAFANPAGQVFKLYTA